MTKINMLLIILFSVFLVSCASEILNEDEYYYIILDKEELVYRYNEYVDGNIVEVIENVKLFLVEDSEKHIFKVKPPIEDWNRYEIGDKVVTRKPYSKWQQ